VALVVVDLRTLDFEVGPAPPAPEGRDYYYALSYMESEYQAGFYVVARPPGPETELLACIDQRVTDDASYCRPAIGGCSLAAVADVLIYPVAASTGGLAGRPWMVAAREFDLALVGEIETRLDFVLLPVDGLRITDGLLTFMER
jgi:hypothetical protein